MRELIDRRALSAACHEIYEEVARAAQPMTAQEVMELMRLFEKVVQAAPTVATATAGFDTCEYYPKSGLAKGCTLLTERVCAVKGRCSFFTPRAATGGAPPLSFSDRVKIARREAGLSTTQVAKAIGVSRETINKWEQGTAIPSQARREKLAEVLGVSLATLENREDFTK